MNNVRNSPQRIVESLLVNGAAIDASPNFTTAGGSCSSRSFKIFCNLAGGALACCCRGGCLGAAVVFWFNALLLLCSGGLDNIATPVTEETFISRTFSYILLTPLRESFPWLERYQNALVFWEWVAKQTRLFWFLGL